MLRQASETAVRTLRVLPNAQRAAVQAAFVSDNKASRFYSTLPVQYEALGPPGRSAISGLKVTVFGCTGFLGRYVCNEMGEIGSRMVLPTRCNDQSRTHLRVMGDLGQINFMDFDAREKEDITKAVAGSNVVINMIGRELETGNFNFETVNIDIAKTIAEACAEQKVAKLVHVSALGADAASPSRYYQTKAAGEEAVKAAFPSASIVRPAVMYGWEDRFFNRMAMVTQMFPFLPLVDGGETKFQPVHVHDVALAVRAIVMADKTGETYELAGPSVHTMQDLVGIVCDTIREKSNAVVVPSAVAKLSTMPFDMIVKAMPFPVSLPCAHGAFSTDAIRSLESDYVASGKLPGFTELGLEPRKLEGLNLDYLRSYRSGGYDFGAEGEVNTGTWDPNQGRFAPDRDR